MDLKFIVASAMAALGLIVGSYELFQQHWIAAISAILLGLIAAGMLLFGREFISHSYIGAGVILLIALLGFYGLFFQSPSLDLKLNEARNEAAIKLILASQNCAGIPNSGEAFKKASSACLFQSNRDATDLASDAAKQIYLPIELGLADAVYNSTQKQKEDPCSSWVSIIHEKCPDVFLSMKKESIQRLLRK